MFQACGIAFAVNDSNDAPFTEVMQIPFCTPDYGTRSPWMRCFGCRAIPFGLIAVRTKLYRSFTDLPRRTVQLCKKAGSSMAEKPCVVTRGVIVDNGRSPCDGRRPTPQMRELCEKSPGFN